MGEHERDLSVSQTSPFYEEDRVTYKERGREDHNQWGEVLLVPGKEGEAGEGKKQEFVVNKRSFCTQIVLFLVSSGRVLWLVVTKWASETNSQERETKERKRFEGKI